MQEFLIQQRAQCILDRVEEIIEHGLYSESPSLIHGYKASFLLAKKDLRLYRRSFNDSGLYFSILEAEAVYEEYSEELDGLGHHGLTQQEKEILEEGLSRLGCL